MKIETGSFQQIPKVIPVEKNTRAETSEGYGINTSPLVISNSEPISKENIKASESDSYLEFSHKPRPELSLDEKEWIALIEKANKAIIGANKSFEYSIHEKTKQIMIKVIDSDTKEVIREIPPEKVLDLVARMWEMAGVLVDERR